MKIERNLSTSPSRSEIIKRGASTGVVIRRRCCCFVGSVVCSLGLLLALAGLSRSVAGMSHEATARTSWIELAPTGGPPSPREQPVAVYDPATNRMIVHGGEDQSGIFSDVWVLTNADGTEGNVSTWTKRLSANPLKRRGHAGVYDSLSNRMIVFGGQAVTEILNDVWVLSNANGIGGDPEWLQLIPSGNPPSARHWMTTVYDAASNRMTIFGGQSDQLLQLNDVWVLTNANGTEATPPSWIQLLPSGSRPAPRAFHTAVHDANSNRMIVFGGQDASFFNDVWVLTNANGVGGDPEWIELAPDGTPPSPRRSPGAGYDPTTSRMVVYGGTNNSVTFGDTWVLTNANGTDTGAPAWLPLAPGGTLATARNEMGATYSVSNNRLSIFAGDNAPICCNLLNDVWVLPDANGIGGSGTCLSPPAGLVSWWSGDKTAEDVLGTNPGVLKNGASFRPGKVGPGFVFDGIDDAVVIPNSPSLSQTRITLDAWVYSTGNIPGLNRHIISKDNELVAREYILGIAGDTNRFNCSVQLPSGPVLVTAITVAQPNTWYQVAMTHDGLKLRLYVNGVLEAIDDAVGDVVPTSNPVGIGGNIIPTLFFQGIIDEAQIFSRALTDAEILAMYQAGADGQCKPDIFVASIDPSYAVSGHGFQISTSIVIQDVNGLGINGATGQLGVILPSGSTLTFPMKTGATGQAVVAFTASDNGLYQFKIRNVNHPTREYDPSLNIETSDTLVIP